MLRGCDVALGESSYVPDYVFNLPRIFVEVSLTVMYASAYVLVCFWMMCHGELLFSLLTGAFVHAASCALRKASR